MPWKSQDAESHNAALKGQPELAKLWADTANGTLQSELAAGKRQSDAEGAAIATANKAVAKKLNGRGEPHGDNGNPEKPVRTVTAAPAVTRGDETELRTRAGQLCPGSIDLDNHTVEAVLGTQGACFSLDLKTRKSFLEVYLMSGAVLPAQVPLCDTHNRESTSKVLGSVRELRVENDCLVGRIFVASTEYGVWSKIRDKHLTDVSWGVQPLETSEIKPGKTQEIQGRSFTAPADRSLFVHTKWRLREVSVTPIGSDDRAKIRSLFLPETHSMKTLIRKWLEETFKLRTDATAEEAQALWDGLSDADRARAEEACREEDDEDEDEDEDDEEDEEPAPAKKSLHRVTRSSVVTEETRAADEAQRVRTEAAETAVAAERKRVAAIKRLAGKDVPEEIVTRAIEEGWKLRRFQGVALEHVRFARSPSVGGGGNTDQVEIIRSLFGAPAGHVRSHEVDCTVATLAASLLTRSYNGNQDPCDLLGGYQASAPLIGDDGKPEAGQCHTVRSDVTRMLSGQASHASDARRTAAERLLEMGDRYRGMTPMDFVDECNRIEGRTRTSYDREERVRAAISGSALSAIFTQNVSAQFLGGYLDAADTTQGWVTESDVLNFLANERAIYGKMGQLTRLSRGGTADDLDTSDWNETYRVYRYAGKFLVDEQDFINDRFGAIAQMSPQDMGLSARQIRPNLVYALLMSNPTLNQDNTTLFHANHNNIVSGAITDFSATAPTANAGPFQDATTLMGKQRLRNRVLNLRPRFVISSTELEWAINILYKSQQRIIASGSGGTYNPLAAEGANVETRFDGRLDPLGCYNNFDQKTYYPYSTTGSTAGRGETAILMARPGEQGAKTVEVGYRTGTGRAPRIRSAILREGSGQYGMAWDVNLDIGVCALDYRGMVLLTGGGSQLAATGPAAS
jgi:hypothetical protein